MENVIKKKLLLLPKKPGIYFFKNAAGEVIYIGKARLLSDRVKSYFQPTSDPKIQNILAETADIDYILTDSEREAAFLENNFIQQHQPKFNLRLKDDKSFPYLKLTARERFPGIYFSRKVIENGAKYFGPFSPAHEARKIIHLINKYFRVRNCQEAVPGKRTRPCLEYDLGLCSAPCVGLIFEADYKECVGNALLLLEGKTEELAEILEEKMRLAAKSQDFEEAVRWRDLIRILENIKVKPKLISVKRENLDIFGYAQERQFGGEDPFQRASNFVRRPASPSRAGHETPPCDQGGDSPLEPSRAEILPRGIISARQYHAVDVFIMRKGKVIESREFFFEDDESIPEPRVLLDFLRSFYQETTSFPEKLLLPFEPAEKRDLFEWLSAGAKRKVVLAVPVRGKYKSLIDLATRNAENLLQKRVEDLAPLMELKKALGLETLPVRIEGFDVSNTGGTETVASLVTFDGGRPYKDGYRKFKVKTVEGPNDVAGLEEVIRRRYRRILEEKTAVPDLVFVDGGKPQLGTALRALQALGLERVGVVSLAKKEEIIFSPLHKNGLRLDRTSPALKLLQHIRDEAHRFAVKFHRQRRSKRSFE
jgi:excinuclease ABC subunit C